MKKLFLLLICLGWTQLYAQDSSKICYRKWELQRIAYRVMHSQYCDTALIDCQTVVENMEQDIEKANRQAVLQQERYTNMEYLFTTCATERNKLTNENDKLKRKLKRTRVTAIVLSGLGLIAWVVLLI